MSFSRPQQPFWWWLVLYFLLSIWSIDFLCFSFVFVDSYHSLSFFLGGKGPTSDKWPSTAPRVSWVSLSQSTSKAAWENSQNPLPGLCTWGFSLGIVMTPFLWVHTISSLKHRNHVSFPSISFLETLFRKIPIRATKKWCKEAGSWAGSAAINSLVGLSMVAHNCELGFTLFCIFSFLKRKFVSLQHWSYTGLPHTLKHLHSKHRQTDGCFWADWMDRLRIQRKHKHNSSALFQGFCSVDLPWVKEIHWGGSAPKPPKSCSGGTELNTSSFEAKEEKQEFFGINWSVCSPYLLMKPKFNFTVLRTWTVIFF